VVSRRGFLKTCAAGATALSLGWRDVVIAGAERMRKQGKSMILLWMDGGPSQFETFNPKIGSANQGPAKAINTNLPGVQIAELMPKTAGVMDKIALIRSMKSQEAEHDRAIARVRTGYALNPAIRYPTFGSHVARARDDAEFDLPAFVRIGKPRIATRDVDSGVLGPKFASFNIDEAGILPPNVQATVSPDVLKRRLALTDKLDAEFASSGGKAEVAEKKQVYDRAARFVLSPQVGAFDLSKESDRLRDRYGRTSFGQGCLLARRLIESGVSFVEVISTGARNDAGWDTHGNGFRDQPNLCAEVDLPYSTLLLDMQSRGLLDNTLVVWMGEFGRTPKLKTDGGRDHYATGWITCLSGGGVKMGQVIGATDKDGVQVTERPVSVEDLFVTFCHVLGLNPKEEYTTPDERPIKLVEGGQLIKELF